MTFDEVKAKFLAAWDAGEVRFSVEHIEDKLEITGLVFEDIRAVVASAATGARDEREARSDGSEKWEFFGFPNDRGR